MAIPPTLQPLDTAPKDGTDVMLWVNDAKHGWVAWEGRAVFREAYRLSATGDPDAISPAGWFWPEFEIYHGNFFVATHWSPKPSLA